MKKSFILIAALVGLGILVPVSADAAPGRGPAKHGPVRGPKPPPAPPKETRVTYDRHGHKIYWVKEFKGRDRKGRPIYRWEVDEHRTRLEREREHRHDHKPTPPKKGFKFFFKR